MFKRKKPRQNSASTSPSSSPPNSGLVGILPHSSDITLNQNKLHSTQQQENLQQQDNNNNNNNNNNSNSSNQLDNNTNSSNNKNKGKKKKNKSTRDRERSERKSSSGSSSPIKSSASTSNPTTSMSGSTASSTPLPINNNSGNINGSSSSNNHHKENKDSHHKDSNHNSGNNNSYSKSPSYPKKYQKPNSPNSNTPIEVLSSKPRSYQKIESPDFEQHIKKEEIIPSPTSSSLKEEMQQSQQQTIEQPQPNQSIIISEERQTTIISSDQSFVPINSTTTTTTTTPSTSIISNNNNNNSLNENKSFIPINSNNNNSLHNHSYQQQNNNNFSYNNSSFNFSKNKSYHNRRGNNSEQKNTHIPLWLQGHYSSRDLSNCTFNKEVELFCQWLEPNEYELRIRQKIIREIENIVKSNWPKAKVVVFGSFSSNLFIPSSDIDIQISDINEGVDKYSFQNPIRDFHSILIKNHQNSFCNVRLISGAKIPIIKMTSLHTQYNIDICFDTPSGIENTQVVKSFLKQYKSMRILLLVLKFFLFQNNLNETYTGGIGSYALALMVVSYIQLRHVPLGSKMSPNGKARRDFKHSGEQTDYGVMLIEFFELYGRLFNYASHGISLENGGFYFKKDETKVIGSGLTLIDPHDPENDVGKNSFNIPFIRGVFCSSFLKLLSNEMIRDHFGRFQFPTLLSRVIEERLVENFARQRANVVKYAHQLEESGQLPELTPIDDLIVKTPPNSELFINNKQFKNSLNNNNNNSNKEKEKEKENNVLVISSDDEVQTVKSRLSSNPIPVASSSITTTTSKKDNTSSNNGLKGGSNGHDDSSSSDNIKTFDKKKINSKDNNNSSSGEEFSEDSNQSNNEESSDVHSSDSNFSSSEYSASDSEFDASHSFSSDNLNEEDDGHKQQQQSRQKLVDPIGFEW